TRSTASGLCFLFVSLLVRPPPASTPFPYTTLFRSSSATSSFGENLSPALVKSTKSVNNTVTLSNWRASTCPFSFNSSATSSGSRSEEHTSELQSRENLVCRLLLEKKKPLETPPTR